MCGNKYIYKEIIYEVSNAVKVCKYIYMDRMPYPKPNPTFFLFFFSHKIPDNILWELWVKN